MIFILRDCCIQWNFTWSDEKLIRVVKSHHLIIIAIINKNCIMGRSVWYHRLHSQFIRFIVCLHHASWPVVFWSYNIPTLTFFSPMYLVNFNLIPLTYFCFNTLMVLSGDILFNWAYMPWLAGLYLDHYIWAVEQTCQQDALLYGSGYASIFSPIFIATAIFVHNTLGNISTHSSIANRLSIHIDKLMM